MVALIVDGVEDLFRTEDGLVQFPEGVSALTEHDDFDPIQELQSLAGISYVHARGIRILLQKLTTLQKRSNPRSSTRCGHFDLRRGEA